MRRRSPLITVLRTVAAVLPGDYLKTVFYRGVIAKPRAALRRALLEFYRFDHVYDVLGEVKANYKGSFSILEFGTHHGYAFTKMLYATEFLGLADRVTVHAFDTFEGLPPAVDRRDRSVIAADVRPHCPDELQSRPQAKWRIAHAVAHRVSLAGHQRLPRDMQLDEISPQ